MTFRVLAEAQAEATAAAAWYEDRKATLGHEFLNAVEDALQVIRESPQLLTRLETYSGESDVRRQFLKRFPYVVVVHCRTDETLVVAIAHTRRRPLYWLSRLE